jgi:hypothetical protein
MHLPVCDAKNPQIGVLRFGSISIAFSMRRARVSSFFASVIYLTYSFLWL